MDPIFDANKKFEELERQIAAERNRKTGFNWALLAMAILLGSFIMAAPMAMSQPLTPNDQGTVPVIGTTGTFSTSVSSPLGKFDTLDAGVLYVAGNAQLGGGLVKVTSVVDVSTDLTVSGNSDVLVNRDVRINGDLNFAGAKLIQDTAPTVVACSGTAASVTWRNATAVLQFDVGTSCAGESTATITMPASATGWVCSCSITTADRILQQKAASSTTAVVLTNIVVSTGAAGDFTDGADAFCICMGG